MRSYPKSDTSSDRQPWTAARAFSSMRNRSSPWSRRMVPRLLGLAMGFEAIVTRPSNLHRQGDGALLVGAEDRGREAAGKASGCQGDDELRTSSSALEI